MWHHFLAPGRDGSLITGGMICTFWYDGAMLPSLIEMKAIRIESQHEGDDEGDVVQEEAQDEERDVPNQDDGNRCHHL